ncbi:ester cyclase [Streptomyces sp. NPDC127033]|uniref:ester cyclase n=1 Tax=Streptomyces sp. NPDC127033 TaxID=3347110 RepID=UPI00365C84CB
MSAATGVGAVESIVTGMLREIWTLGHFDMVPRFIHADYTMLDERAEVRLRGREAFIETVAAFRGMFEEPHMSTTHVICGQDMVAYRWELTGRLADAGLLAPSLRAIERHVPEVQLISHRGLSVARIEDGLIIEEWSEADNVSMNHQMGWWG